MAKIEPKRSFLQSLSDKAMETIRGRTRGGTITINGKQVAPSTKKPPTSGSSVSSIKGSTSPYLLGVPTTNKLLGGNVSVGAVTGGVSPFAIGTSMGTTTTPMRDDQKISGISGAVSSQTQAATQTATQQAQPTLNLANEEKYLRSILSDPNSSQELKNWAIQQGKTYGIDITQPTLEDLRKSATEAQKAFIESGIQSQLTGLEAGRQKALSTLEQQRGLIAPQYQALRTQASNQATQQARNLAEYMAARGQATSGLRAQQELQMGAELQGRFGQIGLAEQQAIQDLENRKTEIGLDYDTKISQAKSEGEREKQSFELQQKLNEIDRIEKEMLQKIQDAKDLEQQKIQAAAAEAKDEADFQRRKELITYETNESIRAAREKASFESKSEGKIKYSEIPEYQVAINSVRKGILPSSTDEKGIQLTQQQIDNGEYVNYLLNNYQEIIDDLTVSGYEALLKEAIKYSKQNYNIDPIMAEIFKKINQ